MSFKAGNGRGPSTRELVEHEAQRARVAASELLADTAEERHGIYPRRRPAADRMVGMILPAGCQLTDAAAAAATSIYVDPATGGRIVRFTPAALVALGVVQVRDVAKPRERRGAPRPELLEH